MRDPDRIDAIVEQLRLTWKAMPDLRLSQLIMNAATCADDTADGNAELWNLEDHLMSYGLGRLYASNRNADPGMFDQVVTNVEGDDAEAIDQMLNRAVAGSADADAQTQSSAEGAEPHGRPND